MPRRPRLDLPGHPMHVTQRGVNRCAIFVDDVDKLHYLGLLGDCAKAQGVAVHAFVLMDNHVHLLLTAATEGGLSRAMREVGQNYVQAFNARHGRSGTLWQGRFKSCLVDSEAYLLAVLRYIELNPVRAAMVERPEDYRWSSVHTHLKGAHDPLLTPHPTYTSLGLQPEERHAAYAQWLMAAVSDDELAAIRLHLAQERVLGNPRFQQMMARTFNREVICRPRGRPSLRTTEVG